MKRFLSWLGVFSLLLLLSACGGDTTEPTSVADIEFTRVGTADLSLDKPTSWNFLTRAEDPTKLPKGVLFIMSAVEPWGAGQTFATVAVAEEKLPQGTSSKQYAEAGSLKTQGEIAGYKKISEESLSIGGQDAKLLEFSGRDSFEGTEFIWQHLFVAQDGKGYVVSSTAPQDATVEQRTLLKRIVTSLAFSAPQQ